MTEQHMNALGDSHRHKWERLTTAVAFGKVVATEDRCALCGMIRKTRIADEANEGV